MLRSEGHVAHVQRDTFGTGTRDVEWLPEVGAQIRRREIELRALRQAGVRAFVLTAGGLTGQDQARVLRDALPAMTRLLRRRATAFVARVTAGSRVETIEWRRAVRD